MIGKPRTQHQHDTAMWSWKIRTIRGAKALAYNALTGLLSDASVRIVCGYFDTAEQVHRERKPKSKAPTK